MSTPYYISRYLSDANPRRRGYALFLRRRLWRDRGRGRVLCRRGGKVGNSSPRRVDRYTKCSRRRPIPRIARPRQSLWNGCGSCNRRACGPVCRAFSRRGCRPHHVISMIEESKILGAARLWFLCVDVCWAACCAFNFHQTVGVVAVCVCQQD